MFGHRQGSARFVVAELSGLLNPAAGIRRTSDELQTPISSEHLGVRRCAVLGPDFFHCGIASGPMPAFPLFPLNNRSRLTINNAQGSILNAEAGLCFSLTSP